MLSFRSLLSTLVLLTAFCVAGCGHSGKAVRHKGPGIGGTVIYITNAKLPDSTTIEVRLLRLDRDGNIDRVVASDTFPKPPAMPLEFWLPYQPGLIEKRETYAMDARISYGGKVLFLAPRPVPVLTKGNPTSVEIVVAPVK
jgi:putative lipoprotein